MKLTVQDLLGDYRLATAQEILTAADHVINRRFRRGVALRSALDSKDLFRHKLALREQEVFAALFLDNKHRVIDYEQVSVGTINSSVIHPREIFRNAILNKAVSVLLCHNHPSGEPEPSRADETITLRLKEALALVDIRLLDHLIVGDQCCSLAERGVM